MLTRDGVAKQMNFHDQQWVLLEAWLKQERETKIGLLLSSSDEKQSDKVRGAIQYIDSLLELKKAALRAANGT